MVKKGKKKQKTIYIISMLFKIYNGEFSWKVDSYQILHAEEFNMCSH